MSDKRSKIRWGLLGAARIASKLVPAIRRAGGEIVSVGARSEERARAFAKEHGIPHVRADYGAVVEDPDVDAVYIPLANGAHFEWAMACAQSGKACLCEKPLVLDPAQAIALEQAFDAQGLLLTEAFMWRHHRQVEWLCREIELGALGVVKRVHATFSFPLDRPDDYRWKPGQGGGALWDVGCYGVNAARLFFGSEPLVVSARSSASASGVDASTVAWLDFGSDRLATVECSFRSAFTQGLIVVGEKAAARLEVPWLSVDRATTVEIDRGDERTLESFEPMNAYAAMAQHFQVGVSDSSRRKPPAESGVRQARAMGALVRSAARDGAPVEVRS